MRKLLMSLLPKHIHGFNTDGTRDARFEQMTIAKLLGVMTRKEKRHFDKYDVRYPETRLNYRDSSTYSEDEE